MNLPDDVELVQYENERQLDLWSGDPLADWTQFCFLIPHPIYFPFAENRLGMKATELGRLILPFVSSILGPPLPKEEGLVDAYYYWIVNLDMYVRLYEHDAQLAAEILQILPPLDIIDLLRGD